MGVVRQTQNPKGAVVTTRYNADDTVQKRTDPRGASATFTYNGRHLLTSINYSKPPNAVEDENSQQAIPGVPTVSFGYDEAGSRLWMTDGQGRVDYGYDTSSRLISEARYFTELNKSFTISYAYNVGGELTRLTDPFGSVIDYSYDRAGQLTAVSGSGYGSVTQLVSAIGYRAWGGLKRMSYGDGSTAEMSYDARLRLTRYTLNSSGNDYQYYSDSRVRSVRQINGNAEFDRSYKYDHAGRMTEALTGRGARGEPTDPNAADPYKQTYQYDSMGNLTARVNTLWNHEVASFQASYVNERNTSWTYDEAGNVKNDLAGLFTWDTALRMTKWESVGNLITQKYDGDGQAALRVETRSDPYFTSTIYYVRSSVLGGQAYSYEPKSIAGCHRTNDTRPLSQSP
jgi:YD repeat-containing protein